MQGTDQPRRASKPLPQINPQVVEACKASNPGFGQAKGPPPEPVAQPVPTSPPPPVAAAPNAPSQPAATAGKRPNIVFILTDDLALNLVQFMPHVVKMQREAHKAKANEAHELALADFCQVLMCLNEFVYVD